MNQQTSFTVRVAPNNIQQAASAVQGIQQGGAPYPSMQYMNNLLSQFGQVLKQQTTLGGSGGGGVGGSGSAANPFKVTLVSDIQTQPSPYQRQVQSTSQNNFLKQLLEFEAIKETLSMMVSNSSIANTYLGAMGKIFGAAMDILLVPFLPLINMLMMGMGMLVEYLVKSGYLETMSKALASLSKQFTEYIGKFMSVFAKNPADAIAMLVTDIVKGILSLSNLIGHAVESAVGVGMRDAWAAFQQYAPEFGKDLANAFEAMLKEQLPTWMGGGGKGNLKETGATAVGLGTLGLTAAAGLGTMFSLASKIPVLGGLFGLGGKAVTGAAGLGMDAIGAALPFLAVGGAGLAGGAGANKLAGMAGIHGILREGLTGAGAGVTAGAIAGLVGGPFAELTVPGGAAIGGLLGGVGGLGKGVIDEIRRHGQTSASGQSATQGTAITNSGNTVNITQHVYQAKDPKQYADDTSNTLRRTLGYSLATGSPTG